MLKLTEEIITQLNEESVEEKRKTLTELHKKGYNIKSYLEDMLACSDGIHCSPEDWGFKSTHFSEDKLWLYNLLGNEKPIIYQELKDKTYTLWLS